LGETLYNYLKGYLFEHVQNVRENLAKYEGDELIKRYLVEWQIGRAHV